MVCLQLRYIHKGKCGELEVVQQTCCAAYCKSAALGAASLRAEAAAPAMPEAGSVWLVMLVIDKVPGTDLPHLETCL